jgi:hypothetical protein
MEEDVNPEDEDGVDGWGVYGWDGWVCGLGVVGVSLAFGLVRGAGTFAVVLPSFALVSKMPFAQRYRGNATSFRAASSSRREVMVGGALVRCRLFVRRRLFSTRTPSVSVRSWSHIFCGASAYRPV